MSTMKYPIPSTEDISKLLSSLLSNEIQAKECEPWQFEGVPCYNIATYKTDTGDLAALCVTDIVAGASMAGMLTQATADVVNEAIKANQLTEELLENIKEVMNIFTSVLNTNTTPHLLYNDFHTVPPALNDNLKKILDNPVDRFDVKLTIPGYPDAQLTIITAPHNESSQASADWEWVDFLVTKLRTG